MNENPRFFKTFSIFIFSALSVYFFLLIGLITIYKLKSSAIITVRNKVEFFCEKNKSAGRFIVCEDFWRLNQLKCGAPESIQAKREPNPSGANWKYAGSVLSEFAKKTQHSF